MEKTILNNHQTQILDEISKDTNLTPRFYLTGGTALSEFYLQHRFSEDLDFFTDHDFDSQIILQSIQKWSNKFAFTYISEVVEPTYIFFIKFPGGNKLKIDFAPYPYISLSPKEKKIKNIQIDSLLDIAVNKLITVNQRNEVKDFVDLYFLLKHFTIWDLLSGVKQKFHQEIPPYILATDLLKCQDFDYLPKMIKPLKIENLKAFYYQLTEKLSKPMTK